MRLFLRTLTLLLLCLGSAIWAGEAQPTVHVIPAQSTWPPVPVFDASGIGDQLTLDHGWLFHPGDDPAWSSPSLDDRSWLPIDLHRPLTTYGFTGIRYGWLRLHVHLPPGARDLVFATDRTLGRYQAFANGDLIGSLGEMSRHGLYDVPFYRVYPLPVAVYRDDGDVVLALRVSLQSYSYESRGPETPFLLGSAYLGTARSIKDSGTAALLLNQGPLAINTIPSFLTAVVALSLFLSLRMQREYLFLAIYALLASCLGVEALESWLRPFGIASVVREWLLDASVVIAFSEFTRQTLGIRRSRWLVLAECLPLLAGSLYLLWPGGLASYALAASVSMLATAIAFAMPLILLARSALAGNLDAKLLLPGTLPYVVTFFLGAFGAMLNLPETFALHLGGFSLRIDTLSDLCMELTLLVFLVTRSVRIARERNRAASEIEAAQTVQKLLLSRSEVESPGFYIERVYRPANEVGGDFFLLLPDARDGSLLAIVGDVSGKGLTAAMHVSVILGVLRCESSRAPEEVLRNLNEILLAQGVTGFTTACCVHLQPTGEYVVANAGHIAPYVAGAELPTQAALPLGIAPDQVYAPTYGWLRCDQAMILLSDGVPEARRADGELYGFERLARLTLQPAETIADTAQRFGQEDDITVLSLSLCA